MLEQAITEIQNIERSVARKTLSDLQIRLALRSCLGSGLTRHTKGIARVNRPSRAPRRA